MAHLRTIHALSCCLVLVLALFGCDDDAAESPVAGMTAAGTMGGAAGSSGAGAGSGTSGTGAGSGTSGTSASDAGSELGPTASIRVVNLVSDVTFDAWGPGPDRKPVLLAKNLTYATASEYFDAPINQLTMYPIFVLWEAGDGPDSDALFSTLLDNTHQRMRIEVRELDGAGERATIILEPQDPIDEDPAAPLEYETLDETELNRGDGTKLNLHISYHLFGIGGGIVDSIALEGEPCLHSGSTSVAQVFSIPAGSSTLAVYDLQTASACSETDPLATLDLEGGVGENLLVTLYREGNDVKMFSALIE